MIPRRLLVLLPLAACAEERVEGRFGDPVTVAALNAPASFGNLSRFRDDPASAARGVANLEFLTDTFQNNPIWAPQANPVLSVQLRQAQAHVRQTLGIAPGVPSATVIEALRTAASLLDANDLAGARRILSPPVFTAGGAETLRRLGDMDNSRVVSAAAQSVSQAGMDGSRGGRRN
ncbi:hypothetical protein ACQW02_22900 [Humitalea sp. 24SJ18S-53]|uniref:hypothetical protein n=1 Tax=Humitalea sp. 24SJ18S-53 TaxID=3422307 RepID=UPI003D67FE4E